MFTVLILGSDVGDQDVIWRSSPGVRTVLHWRFAAPTGKRFGSRAFGIGLDALCLALKAALAKEARGPYMAMNPWTGVALIMTGRRDIVINGLYAAPNSRSWSVLRRIIGTVPVITTSTIESENWNRAGGNAKAVRYGMTLKYPHSERRIGCALRIFVGGTSDRDQATVAHLENEVRNADAPVEVIIADGSGPGSEVMGERRIIRPGWLSQQEFGTVLSSCDVVFLPIVPTGRGAGHMVLVGALEAGVPVLVSEVVGLADYLTARGVDVVDPGRPLLPQLRAHGDTTSEQRAIIRAEWSSDYSLDAYIRQILEATAVVDRV